jgi:hypothetical protein
MGEHRKACSRRGGRVLLAGLLAFVLVCTTLPASALAAGGSSGSDAAQAQIEELLSAGPYTEGEVLAVVRREAAGTTDWFAQSDETVRTLATVSAEDYVTGTGESLDQETDADGGALAVITITNPAMTTEDMLTALLADSRVVSAEPNYTMTPAWNEDGSDSSDSVDEETLAKVRANLTEQEYSDLLDRMNTDAPTLETAGTTAAASESDLADLAAYQWGLKNDSTTAIKDKTTPLDGFDINSPSWNQSGTKNACGVVATLDSGLDVTNPDLDGVVMTDMDKYNSDGGPNGINLSGGDKTDVSDTIGHGTHVAGIIAAEWNGVGTSGVANGVKVVSVKMGTASGQFSLADAAAGYAYLSKAVDNGLNLVAVNNSWGDLYQSRVLSTLVTQLGQKGVVSVFSSGNERINADYNPRTANALKDNPYAIVVNASNRSGQSQGSNYGQSSTDVYAPGNAILSTTSAKATGAGAAGYLAEGDSKPLVSDYFNRGTPETVHLYTDCDESFNLSGKIPRSISTDYYYDGGAAQKIDVSQLSASTVEGIHKLSFYLAIPISDTQNFAHFDDKLFSEGLEDSESVLFMQYIMTETPSGQKEWSDGASDNFDFDTFFLMGGNWKNNRIDMDLVLKDGSKIAQVNGNVIIKVTLSDKNESFLNKIGPLYLDCLAAGQTEAPYISMSGTSMAAPMVTGAAAVAAKAQGVTTQPAAGQRSTLAKERIQWLKSHVTQYDSLKDKCSTGGQIDLSVQLEKVLPVIDNAQLTGTGSDLAVRIDGSHFGTLDGSSKVTIAGKEATVRSWTDGAITAGIPEGLTAGVLPVSVTTADGTCTEGFLLEIPSEANRVLFEKAIALPKDISDNTMGNTMIGLGGKLYVLPQSIYDAKFESGETTHDTSIYHGTFRELWCYDPAADSWQQAPSLPAQLDLLSVTTWNGRLLALGTAVDSGTGAASAALYTYTPGASGWEALNFSGLPAGASIINTGDQVLVVGGAAGSVLSEPQQTDNIRSLDMAAGSLTAAGSIITPCLDPDLVLFNGAVYLTQGMKYESKRFKVIAGMQQLAGSGTSFTATDISGALPTLAAADKQMRYGLAATADGPVISGLQVQDASGAVLDADTFILKGASFADFGKRAWRAPLFSATSTAYDGWLYTMGSTSYDAAGVILRATAISTPSQPGDIASSEGNVSTGVFGAGAGALPAVLCFFAAALAGAWSMRRGKNKV